MFLRNEPCPKCRERGEDTKGDNLAIYDNGSYCFACGYTVKTVKGRHPETKSLKRFPYKWVRFEDVKTRLILPARTSEMVHKYGLHHYNQFGWSKDAERIIFNPPGTEFYEAYSFEGAKPKSIIWGEKEAVLLGCPENFRRTAVITEDLYSALVVGSQCYSIPLFGSVMSEKQLAGIPGPDTIERIVVWLDYDKMANAMAIKNRLLLKGYDALITCTRKDPKNLTYDELQDRLSHVLENVKEVKKNFKSPFGGRHLHKDGKTWIHYKELGDKRIFGIDNKGNGYKYSDGTFISCPIHVLLKQCDISLETWDDVMEHMPTSEEKLTPKRPGRVISPGRFSAEYAAEPAREEQEFGWGPGKTAVSPANCRTVNGSYVPELVMYRGQQSGRVIIIDAWAAWHGSGNAPISMHLHDLTTYHKPINELMIKDGFVGRTYFLYTGNVYEYKDAEKYSAWFAGAPDWDDPNRVQKFFNFAPDPAFVDPNVIPDSGYQGTPPDQAKKYTKDLDWLDEHLNTVKPVKVKVA